MDIKRFLSREALRRHEPRVRATLRTLDYDELEELNLTIERIAELIREYRDSPH